VDNGFTELNATFETALIEQFTAWLFMGKQKTPMSKINTRSHIASAPVQ
jgi:hypothetical protein